MSTLKVNKYSLATQTFGEPLVTTMKKYTRVNGDPTDPSLPGTIVMMAHGAGFCKEMWEPIIEDLFRFDNTKHDAPLIREVWAVDCQNHGEASTLNEDVLAKNHSRFTIWDYAEAFAELVKSPLLGPLDPGKHRIVICGHSYGAVGVVLATSFFNPASRIPFSSMILIDPSIFSKRVNGQDNEIYLMMEKTTPNRRDIWDNSTEAVKYLQKKVARSWDKRVFAKYTEYGLRPLPTAFYPDKTGVTLTTHRLAENYCFVGKLVSFEALDRLNGICIHVPVHLIYGNKTDVFDRKLQDSLISPVSGRSFASIRRIDGTGHLVPHEKPTELAKEIFDIILLQESKLSPSKL